MANFSYFTIQAPAQGLYKEKGSRFISFAYPVQSEEEIKELIKVLKKKYFDARHHGYAFILGPDKQKYRAFDDGEPGHSTGDPILGQIRSRNLTDVLVVVVRYFGGVKLGVGGLSSAYKTAADAALNNSVIIEMDVVKRVIIQYEFQSTTAVMRLVKEFELTIIEQNFTEGGHMLAEVRLQLHDSFLEKVKLLIATGSRLAVAEV